MNIVLNEEVKPALTLIIKGTVLKLKHDHPSLPKYKNRVVIATEDFYTFDHSFSGFCLIDSEIDLYSVNAFEQLTGSVTLSN